MKATDTDRWAYREPDPDDNLEDLAARCERALQIIRGSEPRV